jgi:hypothetical protein
LCQTFRLDASLWSILLSLDQDLAAQTRAGGCPCGGPLHAAPYSRKPRGFPELAPEFRIRFSFCCGVEGCRRRVRPPSTRFLGRRVFLGVVVVLVAALRQGPTPRRMGVLCEHFGVDRRTVERWGTWWRERFPVTRCWRALRGRLLDSGAGTLPWRLVELLGAWSDPHQQGLMLGLLSPLSSE